MPPPGPSLVEEPIHKFVPLRRGTGRVRTLLATMDVRSVTAAGLMLVVAGCGQASPPAENHGVSGNGGAGGHSEGAAGGSPAAGTVGAGAGGGTALGGGTGGGASGGHAGVNGAPGGNGGG